MKIAYIGKFWNLHDEEYIARSFEMIGHVVLRLELTNSLGYAWQQVMAFKPDLLLYGKFPPEGAAGNNDECMRFIDQIKAKGIKTAAWLFDLYFGYDREQLIKQRAYFFSDYVFSTDGGHDVHWRTKEIKHFCVRQGIYRDECTMLPFNNPKGIAFVGSKNGGNMERVEATEEVKTRYGDLFKWFGKKDTNEVRGMALNELYARTKVVIGDSVYSPYYWSNRVVETLGRGGFLIHVDVPGIKEAYPYLVTYTRGNLSGLFNKIEYYLNHEAERREIVQENFEWVKTNCTADKRCAELISKIE